MSNRFHPAPKPDASISAEEIAALLNPNNQNATHSTEWATPPSAKKSKEDILAERREAIRTAHATDYTQEVDANEGK